MIPLIKTWSCAAGKCHEKDIFLFFVRSSVLANTREHWVSLNRALIRCDKAHICGMIDCSITFIIVLESAKIHLTMKGRTKRKPFIFHGFSQKNIWLCFHENMLDN